MDTATQQQFNVRELQRTSSPLHSQLRRNVHSLAAPSYAVQSGSSTKEKDGSLREAKALFINQQAEGAGHFVKRNKQQCAQKRTHACEDSGARSQQSLQQESEDAMNIDTGSGEASDTVVPDMNQECKSDDCQVGQEHMSAEVPDKGNCSKKQCNTREVADNCDADTRIDEDDAQHNNPRDVLAQAVTIDRDCVMTDSDCAEVLMGLKQKGLQAGGSVQTRALCMNTIVYQRNPPIRVYTDALRECAATYGFWVNRDSWWEDQDARPLFRRCGNNGKDNVGQPSVEAYQLWDYPAVPAKVILDMWKYLKLGEAITIRGKVVPSGTLFNEVIKALKEVKELYRAALSKAGAA